MFQSLRTENLIQASLLPSENDWNDLNDLNVWNELIFI